jgi:nucleotide-binding universal stress UspA family protein
MLVCASAIPQVFAKPQGPGRKLLRYKRGEVVFHQGDPADSIYFIVAGRIRLSVTDIRGKQATLGLLGEIVNGAPCAVLTVGPHICSKWVSEPKLRSILYATDLLPGSATALKYAVWLAEQEHARLTLLHVLKVPTDVHLGSTQAEKAMATKRLVQLLPPDTAPAVRREFIVEIGAPAEHIVRVAKDLDADLIVMGPHHTSHAQLSAHLPWVAPHQVLCQVQRPVLTVPDWMRPIAEKTPQDG